MERIVFKTKKADKTFTVMYVGLLLFLLAITIFTYIDKKDSMVFLPMGIIIGFLFLLTILSNNWLQIIIENDFLTVRLFFDLYKTNIKNITKIRKGETMWSGFHKYGTTTKGLIIFAKYKNDLYITPENEELFYQKILEINPDVVIEKVCKTRKDF